MAGNGAASRNSYKRHFSFGILLMWLPHLAGFMLFYLIPLGISAYYSLTDPSGRFVLFANYENVFGNRYFLLALKNTLFFMASSILLSIAAALPLALWICSFKKRGNVFCLIFMLPTVIPSSAAGYFWNLLFASNGFLNYCLSAFFDVKINWFNSEYAKYAALFVFIWKYLGYNLILFIAGMKSIPDEYYEYARIEGGRAFQIFKTVTVVYLLPSLFAALIMSLYNSFKIYKELFIISGAYPHDGIYTLQHYLNNVFAGLDYQKLSSASFSLTLILVLVLLCVMRGRKIFSFF